MLPTLSYNLVAIMKAATALIVVSNSPSIKTPQMICFLFVWTEMKTWYALQYNARIA